MQFDMLLDPFCEFGVGLIGNLIEEVREGVLNREVVFPAETDTVGLTHEVLC